jgi:hypothetical protein
MENIVMSQHETIADQILEEVRRHPGCQLDELALSLSSLPWRQVFVEVACLNRTGEVQVTFGARNCSVSLEQITKVSKGHTHAGK